jgi:hypothetical protein
MRDYEALLKAGNAAQMEKLEENEHKEGFEKLSVSILSGLLYEEVNEFQNATSVQEIRREAADIANYAHMIIYTCDKIIANG